MENPYQTPGAKLEPVATRSDIDSLNVSDTWKKRFHIIERAGPFIKGKYQNITSLTTRERRVISFNILAFLFSGLYYLAKGMPKKALVLMGFSWIFSAALTLLETAYHFSAPNSLYWIPLAVVTSMLANHDYYQKKVCQQDMWPTLNVFDSWAASVLFSMLSLGMVFASAMWQQNVFSK